MGQNQNRETTLGTEQKTLQYLIHAYYIMSAGAVGLPW